MPAMMDRRRFFATLGAAAWLGRPAFHGQGRAFSHLRAAAQARAMVRTGAIGRVAFCRAADCSWMGLASEICGDSTLIAEVDPAGASSGTGAVILGSEATLVVDSEGCWLLP
jgi:hypothetical protein